MTDNTTEGVTGAPHVSHICGDANAVLDVLFVHGLTGDSNDTWTTGEEYWPNWLCEMFPAVSVYAVGYPSSIFEKWAKKEMNLHERANNILEHLAARGIGERPIAFICHSLGGILVKEVLRISSEAADDGWRAIAQRTRLVSFLATPHTGASLASVVKLIVPRLASNFVELLTNDSGYLTSLNQSFRDFAASSQIVTIPYFEKHKTRDAVLVVSPDSADPGVPGVRPVPVDADHISICKPKDREALIFTSLCRHLRRLLNELAVTEAEGEVHPFAADDYGTRAEADRRDLLQKLIEAGREHEYQKANNLQNKFAQRYYKLGLYTEARTKSDAILASVEQRFLTHVYNSKICKGASHEEIAAALQKEVIDPLSQTGSSASSILQAIYFLTEQCYIQWDKI